MTNFLAAAVKNFLKLRQVEFPSEFDGEAYRRVSPALAQMSESQLFEHYSAYGRGEGYPGNSITNRGQFVALVPGQCRALEIGPFAYPMLRGPKVAYCDVLSWEELKQRAVKIGLNPQNVPKIDFVLGPQGLDAIPEDFDAVISSHNLEHQPDMVRHLQQAHRRIERNGGRLFLIIPDKRYCFDHFIAESTIAQIVDAYESGRSAHTLQSVVEHRALTTHNEPAKHWLEPMAPRPMVNADAVRKGIEEWRAAKGGYIDVHAWYFTPDSFAQIIDLLYALGLIKLQVERLYPTRRNSLEFWAILK